MGDRVPVLLLTGTVGAGKTTVAYEINDVLADLQIPNATIDLDALTAQWPPSSPWNADLMFENLALLWPNYQAHGVTHLILPHVLEERTELDRCRAAVPGGVITVVRLVSPQATRVKRLLGRMPPGPSREWHLRRTVDLETMLEVASHEDFIVCNGDEHPRDVAIKTLTRVGWI